MLGSSKVRQKRLVYVIEPHPLGAVHLVATLKRVPGVEVILSDINLPCDAALSSKSSLLVVDADALPFPLVAYLRTVRVLFKDVQVLVIGKPVSDETLCRLLFHGVRGFVRYGDVDEQVGQALEAVFRGHTWLPPQVLERCAMLSSAMGSEKRQYCGDLSPREEEVLGLLGRGLCNKEIGSALGISERTVRFHLHNIFEKAGVQDRHGLIDLARVGGLERPPDAERGDQRAPGRRHAGLQPLGEAA